MSSYAKSLVYRIILETLYNNGIVTPPQRYHYGGVVEA
jgi:hypothetical protein